METISIKKDGLEILVRNSEFLEDPLLFKLEEGFGFLSTHRKHYWEIEYKEILDKKGCYINQEDFNSLSEIERFLFRNNYIFKKVYLYSHSGETISDTPFSCGFDSGTMGFLYISKQEIRNLYGVKKITKKILNKINEEMSDFINNTWDGYVCGDCLSVEVTDSKEDSFFFDFYTYDSARDFLKSEYEINLDSHL